VVAVILIFGFFGIALGTGWVAQLLVGKRGRVDWTQAFWVGLAGMGLATVVGYLLDKDAGTTFGFAGFLVAIGSAAVIQYFLSSREAKEHVEERTHEQQLTPEGLPGHHQPKKHPAKKKKKKKR
jgi:putative flippase GtrA